MDLVGLWGHQLMVSSKQNINLIFVLAIWWSPCVESSIVLLVEGVCYDQCVLLVKLYYPFPCFILYSKAKFACYSRCFLTSYFCIPVPCNEMIAAAAKSLQSCLTLCDSIDGSPPGSPVPGISRQEHWSGLPFPSPMHESEKWKWSRSIVSHPQRPHGLQPSISLWYKIVNNF